MRRAFAALAAAFIALVLTAGSAAQSATRPAPRPDFNSRNDVVEWIDSYRLKPAPEHLPAAVRALSKAGALRETDSSGFFVGFVAGVLGANPKRAEALAARMLPLPPSDQWFLVRAIAYSSLPAWQQLLKQLADRMPAKRVMIDEYLSGKQKSLDALELDKSPGFFEKVKMHFRREPVDVKLSFGNNPELLDTLWGIYFATGDYRPIWRILTMLPWSKEHDSVERLTVGSGAKYTLANNAARYPDLLALLKDMAPYQPPEVGKILAEVITSAETMQTTQIRKQQLAAIDDLKRKGPGYRRDVALWGQVGQGAIALGCIALATASLTVAGLPCVIGGAATSAALNYWTSQ
jgi:hypothetical protein